MSPDSQYTTIQAAVNAAHAGDTILLAPGTYAENVTIAGKYLTIDGMGGANGAGGAVLDGSITQSGELDGALTIDGLAINATGQQYGVSLTPTLTGAETIAVNNVSIDGASQSGLAVFGGGANLTVDVQHSTFDGNGGQGSFGGTGDVLFYNYTGDAALAHVTVTGTTGTVAASADHGIQFSGVPSGTSPVTSAIGHVSFDDVHVTGTYEKTLVYLQGYDNYSGLSFTDTHIGDSSSATSWTGLYIEPDSTSGVFTPSAGTSSLDLSHVSFGGGHYGWQTAFNLPGADDLIKGVPTVNDITGSPGNDAIVSANGHDVLTGGLGDDTFAVTQANFHGAEQSVTGGGGNDTLWVTDTGSITVTDADLLNVLGVGTLRIGGTAADSVTLDPTPTTTSAARAYLFTVDGSAGTGSLTVNGSAMTANLNLIGGSGSDTLTGGSGNDTLTGGAGNDTLTGGAGADVFKFSAQGPSNLDRILDFSNAQGDRIDISALLGNAAARRG